MYPAEEGGFDMATKKLGKLTYRLSDDGLAFRWGDDGRVHRLDLSGIKRLLHRGNPEDDGYAGEDEAYGYDDPGYDDDERYGSRYDDDHYDDDRYDDRDGRRRRRGAYDGDSDDYGDDRYDDYDDDRYRQPDDENEYYEPGYDDEYDAPSRLDAVWDLLDRFPWIVYILLVLIPPLGIWLLWRQKQFDFTIRTAISVVSGIWFLAMMIWIITALTGGSGNDPTKPVNGSLTLNTLQPTAIATDAPLDVVATPEPSADASVEPAATGLDVAPTPTALASSGNAGVETGEVESGYVYSPTTGTYYHKTATCSSIGTAAVTQVTVDVAQARGQSQCPTCYGAATYYMTESGKWYHSNQFCQNMTGAISCTKEVATKAGKTACPECVREFYVSSTSPYYHSKSNCSGMTNASQTTMNAAKASGKTACPTCVGTTTAKATVAPTGDTSKATNANDKSGITVYAKSGGKYYHKKSSCSAAGMSGGTKYTLYNAIKAGFSACPKCLPTANDTVYCTEKGTYYHSYSTCSSMSGAEKTTLARALAVGKKKCPTCWGSSTGNADSSSNSSGSGSTASSGTASGPNVYVSSDNNQYHTKSNCSGMSNAKKVSLKEALADGKKACSKCASSADKTVYASKSDTHYHYSSSCSAIKGTVTRGTLAQALIYNLTACPTCVKGSSTEAQPTATPVATSAPSSSVTDKSGISVYATKSGKYYHSSTSCSKLGADEFYKVSLGTAVSAGKSACPSCCSTASHKVYSASGDKYYHYTKSCSHLTGSASSGTLAQALMYGLKACPYCTKNDDEDDAASNKATASPTKAPDIVSISSSTSGKKVYATLSGKYYHTKSSCGSNTNMYAISLETAKNYGKTACPTCASSATKKVYAASGNKYYHTNKTCGGMTGAKSGTVEKALLAGLKACPVCVTGSSSSGSSSSGSSGSSGSSATPAPTKKPEESGGSTGGSAAGTTKVYIDLSTGSEIYHKSSKCSALSEATGVTLNYVLDMGFKGCSKCNPPTSVSND